MGDDEVGPRVTLDFVTVSGGQRSGLRVTLPIATAREQGIEAGDQMMVQFDPQREEWVLKDVDKL